MVVIHEVQVLIREVSLKRAVDFVAIGCKPVKLGDRSVCFAGPSQTNKPSRGNA
jgi:hypothetical protein